MSKAAKRERQRRNRELRREAEEQWMRRRRILRIARTVAIPIVIVIAAAVVIQLVRDGGDDTEAADDTTDVVSSYPLGSVAWAKAPAEPPGTAGSQFFIVTGEGGAGLEPEFGFVGTVVEGLEVAQAIMGFAPPEGDGPPTTAVTIESVTITEDGSPLEPTEGVANGEIVRTYDAAPPVTIDPEAVYMATIETSEGTIVIDLAIDHGPDSVNNFVFLARNRFYDGLEVVRAATDFVIQMGSPDNTQAGGPGYSVQTEVPPASTAPEG